MPAIIPRLHSLKTNAEFLSRHPRILQETLLSLPACDKLIVLEVLDAIERFQVLNEFELTALVRLIENVFGQSWLLSARIIERLRPRTRHAVAAQLSEDTRNKILEVLRCIGGMVRTWLLIAVSRLALLARRIDFTKQ